MFDLAKLHAEIDRERKRRGITWARLSRDVGVSLTTMRRFREADDAEADGVLALIRWLEVAPEDFIAGSVVVGEPLPAGTDGFVRVDMKLIAAESGGAATSGRTRTTIQRLVAGAQRSHRSVASFTRRSPT